jgi:hypothetical protein
MTGLGSDGPNEHLTYSRMRAPTPKVSNASCLWAMEAHRRGVVTYPRFRASPMSNMMRYRTNHVDPTSIALWR